MRFFRITLASTESRKIKVFVCWDQSECWKLQFELNDVQNCLLFSLLPCHETWNKYFFCRFCISSRRSIMEKGHFNSSNNEHVNERRSLSSIISFTCSPFLLFIANFPLPRGFHRRCRILQVETLFFRFIFAFHSHSVEQFVACRRESRQKSFRFVELSLNRSESLSLSSEISRISISTFLFVHLTELWWLN